MKPGLLQPTLVRVSDDAAMTIRELTRAVKVVHRVYGPWPSFQAEEVPAGHGAQVAQEGLVVAGGRDEGARTTGSGSGWWMSSRACISAGVTRSSSSRP